MGGRSAPQSLKQKRPVTWTGLSGGQLAPQNDTLHDLTQHCYIRDRVSCHASRTSCGWYVGCGWMLCGLSFPRLAQLRISMLVMAIFACARNHGSSSRVGIGGAILRTRSLSASWLTNSSSWPHTSCRAWFTQIRAMCNHSPALGMSIAAACARSGSCLSQAWSIMASRLPGGLDPATPPPPPEPALRTTAVPARGPASRSMSAGTSLSSESNSTMCSEQR